jgi:hypothetical protein
VVEMSWDFVEQIGVRKEPGANGRKNESVI